MQYFDDLDLIVEAILREEAEALNKNANSSQAQDEKNESIINSFETTTLSMLASLILQEIAGLPKKDKQAILNERLREAMPTITEWRVFSDGAVKGSFKNSISKSFFNYFVRANSRNGNFMVNANCLRATRLKKVAAKKEKRMNRDGIEVEAKYEKSKLKGKVTENDSGQKCVKYETVNPSFCAASSNGVCLVATFKTNEKDENFGTDCKRIGNLSRRIVGVTSTMPVEAFNGIADVGLEGFDNGQASKQAHARQSVVRNFFSDPNFYSQTLEQLKKAETDVDINEDVRENLNSITFMEGGIDRDGLNYRIKTADGVKAYSYEDACHCVIDAARNYANSIAELNDVAQEHLQGFKGQNWAIQLLFKSWDLSGYSFNGEPIVDGSEKDNPVAKIGNDWKTIVIDTKECGRLPDLDRDLVTQSDIQDTYKLLKCCKELEDKFTKSNTYIDQEDAEANKVVFDTVLNLAKKSKIDNDIESDNSPVISDTFLESFRDFLEKYRYVVNNIYILKSFQTFISKLHDTLDKIMVNSGVKKDDLEDYREKCSIDQNLASRYLEISYLLDSYMGATTSTRITREIKVDEGIALSNTDDLMQLKPTNFDAGLKKVKTVEKIIDPVTHRTKNKIRTEFVEYDRDNAEDAAAIEALREEWKKCVAVNIQEKNIIDIVSCRIHDGLTAFVIYCKNNLAYLIIASTDGTAKKITDYFTLPREERMKAVKKYKAGLSKLKELNETGQYEEAEKFERNLRAYESKKIHAIGKNVIRAYMAQITQRALEMIGVYEAPESSYSEEYKEWLREYRIQRDKKAKEEAEREEAEKLESNTKSESDSISAEDGGESVPEDGDESTTGEPVFEVN